MIAMLAPHYFSQSKTEQCNRVLRNVTSCGIMDMYPTGYRGGTHDCNGRRVTNRRGGGSQVKDAPIHGQKTAARWNNSGDQSFRSDRINLESQAVGSRPIDGATRDQLKYSGKLNYFAFSEATQRTAMKIGTLLTERCCKLLPHVHYSESAGRSQQVQALPWYLFACDGPEVAGRNNLIMITTTPVQNGTYTLITPDGQEISISPLMGQTVEALANDVPLYQSEPQKALAASYCRKCQKCAPTVGYFCEGCMELLLTQEEEIGLPSMWFTLDNAWAISVAEWEQRQAGNGVIHPISTEQAEVIYAD